MLTYHIGADGMKVYRDGKLIAHIHPDHYPNIMARMASEHSSRWNTTERQDHAEATLDN